VGGRSTHSTSGWSGRGGRRTRTPSIATLRIQFGIGAHCGESRRGGDRHRNRRPIGRRPTIALVGSPTLGLIAAPASRRSRLRDTAGPMARTAAARTLLLAAISAPIRRIQRLFESKGRPRFQRATP
jgi:hypothetical protein